MKYLLVFLTLTLFTNSSFANSEGEISPEAEEMKDPSRSRKASRIRALFDRLKAIQDRGRSRWDTPPKAEEPLPVARVEKELEAPKEVPVNQPERAGSDFDRFLFEDDASASPAPETPARQLTTIKSEEVPVQVEQGSYEEEGVIPLDGTGEHQYEFEDVEQAPAGVNVKEMQYVVQPGDALLLIARKIYRDPKKFKDIMAWNDLKSVNLTPNQVLILRDVPQALREEYTQNQEQKKEALFPPETYKYKVYKVGYGDSLARIATKFLGSQTQYLNLANLNGIDPQKVLYVGQKMIIPVKK